MRAITSISASLTAGCGAVVVLDRQPSATPHRCLGYVVTEHGDDLPRAARAGLAVLAADEPFRQAGIESDLDVRHKTPRVWFHRGQRRHAKGPGGTGLLICGGYLPLM